MRQPMFIVDVICFWYLLIHFKHLKWKVRREELCFKWPFLVVLPIDLICLHLILNHSEIPHSCILSADMEPVITLLIFGWLAFLMPDLSLVIYTRYQAGNTSEQRRAAKQHGLSNVFTQTVRDVRYLMCLHRQK